MFPALRTYAVLLGLAGLLLAPGFAAAQAAEEDGQVRPSAAQRYYISGTELMQNFRYLDAAEQFRLAIDEDPEFIDAYKSLAYVYTKMAETEEEYYEDALEIYEELEAKLPEDAEIKSNKAYVFTKLGETRSAIDTYLDILDLQPDDCETWARVGELHAQLADEAGQGTEEWTQEMDEAIQAYTEITERCPDQAYAYNKLGEFYFKKGDIESATAVYDKLLEREPDNVDVNGRVGYLWYSAGKDADKKQKGSGKAMYEKAIPYFEKVLSLDPDRTQYRALYADALKKAGHHLKAADEYMKIIEADPENQAKLYCNVGFTYLDAKEYEKAIEMAMKAIAENAPSQDCLYAIWGKGLEMRANAMVENYQFDRAIATYTDAKAKFTLALGGDNFGDYALKQVSRQDQLIERAKALKLKYDQETGGSN